MLNQDITGFSDNESQEESMSNLTFNDIKLNLTVELKPSL